MRLIVKQKGTIRHEKEYIHVKPSTDIQEFEEAFAKKLIEFNYAIQAKESISNDKKEVREEEIIEKPIEKPEEKIELKVEKPNREGKKKSMLYTNN